MSGWLFEVEEAIGLQEAVQRVETPRADIIGHFVSDNEAKIGREIRGRDRDSVEVELVELE
jgi:hypothetical protein